MRSVCLKLLLSNAIIFLKTSITVVDISRNDMKIDVKNQEIFHLVNSIFREPV